MNMRFSPLRLALLGAGLLAVLGTGLLVLGLQTGPRAAPGPAGPKPAKTEPPIEWTPKTLTVTLSPGESKQVNVTATVRSAIPATTAEFVPSLAPYATAEPATLPAFRPGVALYRVTEGVEGELSNDLAGSSTSSEQEFTFSFSVPDGAEFQTIDGILHLRVGSQTIARPLPIVLNIWPLFEDDEVGFEYPPSWNARRLEVTGDNDPRFVAFEALSPGGSQFLVFPNGGYGYGLDDDLTEMQTLITIDGFQGIRRDLIYPNGNVLTRLELQEVSGHPAFRIELRLEDPLDRNSLEAILATVKVRD